MTIKNTGRIKICKFIHQAVLKNSGTTLIIYSVSEKQPSKTHGNINICKRCRRSGQVRQICQPRLWSKRRALVSTKRHFCVYRIVRGRSPDPSFEISLKQMCKKRGGYYKNNDPGIRIIGRGDLWGRTFRVNLPKTICQPATKRDPGTHQC